MGLPNLFDILILDYPLQPLTVLRQDIDVHSECFDNIDDLVKGKPDRFGKS